MQSCIVICYKTKKWKFYGFCKFISKIVFDALISDKKENDKKSYRICNLPLEMKRMHFHQKQGKWWKILCVLQFFQRKVTAHPWNWNQFVRDRSRYQSTSCNSFAWCIVFRTIIYSFSFFVYLKTKRYTADNQKTYA